MCPSVINNSTNKFTPRSLRSASCSGGRGHGWAGLPVGGATPVRPIRTQKAEDRPPDRASSIGCSCRQSREPPNRAVNARLLIGVRGTRWLKEIHAVLSSVPGPECVGRSSELIQIYNFASLALSILFAADCTAWLEQSGGRARIQVGRLPQQLELRAVFEPSPLVLGHPSCPSFTFTLTFCIR